MTEHLDHSTTGAADPDETVADGAPDDATDIADDADDLADAMSEQSFPTSDPPSTWAGSDDPAS